MELGRLLELSIPEIKVCQRKTGTQSIRTQRFCQENPKAGDINYGMIAHGNDKSRNTAIHDVITRLNYCHRAELSMQFIGRIRWQKADGASISKGCSFNLSWGIARIWSIKKFRVDLQEAVYKEAVRKELRTQQLIVAKLEEQNLEISKIRQELKDSRTIVHDKVIETQNFGKQLQKY